MSSHALFQKAYAHHLAGNLAPAIEEYKHLLSLEPQHVEGLRYLGLAYGQQGEMQRAIECFEQARTLLPNDVNLLTNLAHVYKTLGHRSQAMALYNNVLNIDANYAQAHHNIANIYAAENNDQQALHHYHLAVQARPDFIEAHYNLGLLFLKKHQLDAAKTEFQNVIALNSEHAQAHFYLGLFALQQHHLNDAEHHLNATLLADPEHIEARVNLGVVALKQAQMHDKDPIKGQHAIDHFTKALTLNPNHIEARNNLAATFMHYDRFENALTYYEELLKDDPKNIEYLYNYGVAAMTLGQLNAAQTHFQTILATQANHFPSLGNLAAIELRLGHRKQAIQLLEKAHRVNPNDKVTAFMLNALTQQQDKANACPDYAKNLFDQYALYYDRHMENVLKSQLPQHIGKALLDIDCPHVHTILDLGCGSGLVGRVLKPFCDQLIGVDLSPNMLNEARKKELYSSLHEMELTTFLKQNSRTYPLIVAADVLPYLGELESLFCLLPSKLAPSGLFLFSIEVSHRENWCLQDTIRFAHHPDYIQSLCDKSHLSVITQQKIIAREHEHQHFEVMLWVVQAQASLSHQ